MSEKTQSIFMQSLERAVTAMARVAPGLLALLVVFAASMAAALVVRVGLQAALRPHRATNRWAVRWGVASPEAGRATPSTVVVRLGTGSIIAFGILLGLGIFDAAAKTALTSRAADYAPHVLAAVVIFVVGVAGARVLERRLLISAVNFGMQSARVGGWRGPLRLR